MTAHPDAITVQDALQLPPTLAHSVIAIMLGNIGIARPLRYDVLYILRRFQVDLTDIVRTYSYRGNGNQGRARAASVVALP